MTEINAATKKMRLRAEFQTGDPQKVITTRLTEEGLGKKLRDGTLQPWTQTTLSKAFIGMGLRRHKGKGSKKTKKFKRKSTGKKEGSIKKVLVREDCIAIAVSILKAKQLPDQERISVALKLLEA